MSDERLVSLLGPFIYLYLPQSRAAQATKFLPRQVYIKALKGNGPFHTDQSESFMVSPEKDRFKCFGCGKEGGTA
jgi:hypothetical protein